MSNRMALAAVALGVTGAVAAPSALAQAPTPPTVDLARAGATQLKLDKGTARALATLGVKVKPLRPASVKRGAINFPITSGSIDPKTVSPALINHSGGLKLSAGKTKVKLRNFRIRVGASGATLSAAVGNSRATIIKLGLANAKITRPRSGPLAIGTRVSKVAVRLNKTGARALNGAFGTSAFKRGLKLGTAVVDARPSQLIVESGSTALTLDAATATLLKGAGIAPAPISPATADASGALLFPIVPSRIAVDLTSGSIGHTGGISLTKGATTLALTNFDVKLAAAPSLAASVTGVAGKVDILNLDPAGATTTASGRTGIVVGGVKATINKTASDALNATFGTGNTEGATLGTVVVSATAR